jgi:hypothetical protein
LEEQMTVIEAELTKLKSELNNMVATPTRSNLHSSPPHYNYDDIDSMKHVGGIGMGEYLRLIIY